jgi:hypothetical protein
VQRLTDSRRGSASYSSDIAKSLERHILHRTDHAARAPARFHRIERGRSGIWRLSDSDRPSYPTVKPCASIMASVQSSRQETSNSRSRRRSGLGPLRRRKLVVGMVRCAYSGSTPCHKTRSRSTARRATAPTSSSSRLLPGRRWRSQPSGETAVLQHFQARMPYGLVVPEAERPPDDG